MKINLMFVELKLNFLNILSIYIKRCRNKIDREEIALYNAGMA